MSQAKAVEGIFAIDKPETLSSAQVIRDLQRAFNPSALFASWLALEKSNRDHESKFQRKRRKDKRLQVKVGHGGTLDPLATGVLIIGVGSGTKQLQSFLGCTKSYETTLLFGAATDTYDVKGKILEKAPFAHVTREKVEKALEGFRGKIMQRPPIFSALRVQGKRLYDYAREGKTVPVEIQERPVTVEKLEIMEWLEPGSHDYKWPSDEAPGEEKMVAEKVLHLGKERHQAEPSQTSDPAPTPATPVKRKRLPDGDDEDGLVFDLQSPAKRHEPDPELLMSGGLPPSDTIPDTNSTPKADETASASTKPDHPPLPTSVPPPSPPSPPAVKLRMTVTSGFYVRSLCHDLGKAVGSLGIMASLVRTRQGDYELGKNALDYDDLGRGEEVWGPKVERMLTEWQETGRGKWVGDGRTGLEGEEAAQGEGGREDEEVGEKATSDKVLLGKGLAEENL